LTATLQDVARLAGVSVATASRALSGRRRVSDAVSTRVQEAAGALGYRPNMVASALRRQVTDTIGLVVPQITNPFFPALVESVDWELRPMAKQLLLCDARRDPEIEAQRLQALIDRQVDGIMVSPCDVIKSSGAVRATAKKVPLVQVDRRISGEATDWVGVDDFQGIRLLVEHAAKAGTATSVFVGAEPKNSSARERLAAFSAASDEFSIASQGALLGDFTAAWGAEAARQIIATGPLPDVVVCANDLIAIGVMREFLTSGIRVPDDVLVTGFDDIASAELSTPSLTTVRQPHGTIAREALRLLLERMEHSSQAFQRIAVTPELVIRESTTGLTAGEPRRPWRHDATEQAEAGSLGP
jgi:LacI family transcriptional regulator